MKKFYAFFAAALISVCAFAAKNVVPSDDVIKAACDYEDGQVCVGIFVPDSMACFDVVLTGTYNDWSGDAANCAKFVAIEGYDGWYAVAVEDDGRPEDPTKEPYENLQEKPVMLDVDGNFNWNYQVGAATKIRGGVTVVEGSYPGEIDLKTYGTDAPNVFTVDAWKQNPCKAKYHNYRVEVISVGCDGFAVPFIVGDMTDNWKFFEMQIDVEKTQALQVPVYSYSFKAAEGHGFQIVSGLRVSADSITLPGWNDASYLQEFVDNAWQRINGGANFVLGEQLEYIFDLRETEKYRWTRCAPDEREDVAVTFTAPAGAPEIVEIIGTFDDWKGTVMTLGTDGKYTATVRMQATDKFKFRSGVGETDNEKWAVQIQVPDTDPESETGWKDMSDLSVSDWWDEEAKTLDADLSDEEAFRWTPASQGIEEVVLTEKAHKVIVDGVLYIVRDNKMFNIQGAQVR